MLSDERMRALNVAGRNVLLLFKIGASNQDNPAPGGIIPAHDARGQIHFAFAIARDDEAVWRDALAKRNIGVESVVWPERGGVSIYFRDPDGHLVELATPGIWTIY